MSDGRAPFVNQLRLPGGNHPRGCLLLQNECGLVELLGGEGKALLPYCTGTRRVPATAVVGCILQSIEPRANSQQR